MWIVSREWQEWAEKRMVDEELSQNELARRVGVSSAAMSHLFKPLTRKIRQTRLLPAINRELGGDPPIQTTVEEAVDAEREAFGEAFDLLTDEQQAALRELVMVMAASRRKPDDET